MSQLRATVSDKQCARRTSALSGMNGSCLPELLIGLAAGVIVLATVLEIFSIVRLHVARQQRDLAHQQDLRLGLAVFEQEARLATAESIIIANSDEFQFRANINAQRTTTIGDIAQGQSVLAVQDGSGWGEGKSVAICGLRTCELHRLARAGQRTLLTLAEPLQSAFPTGASVEVRNHVVYYTKHDEQGLLRLMRMVDGGAGTLVGGLDNARFAYRDDRGRATSEPSRVKRVAVEIESNRSTHHAVREVSLRS
jgi:hypothetical protein